MSRAVRLIGLNLEGLGFRPGDFSVMVSTWFRAQALHHVFGTSFS